MGAAGWGAVGELRLDHLGQLKQEHFDLGRAKVAPETTPVPDAIADPKLTADETDEGHAAATAGVLADNIYAEIARRGKGIHFDALVEWCGQPREIVQTAVSDLTEQMLIYDSAGRLCAL
jgi:hypothetical protein